MPEPECKPVGLISPQDFTPLAMPVGMLRLAGIVEESCVDGPGLRYVLFTQGCPHGCKGCHNPETHSCTGGTLYHGRDIVAAYAENPLLAGITFSGGEPFLQAAALTEVARAVHMAGGTVVTYTGYCFEHLCRISAAGYAAVAQLLDETDLLIDGPYMESLRDLELPFRGSSNQRLLDRTARATLLTPPQGH